VIISKIQIIIIDKQLSACHRETQTYIEGRCIKCWFEISKDHYATFIPVYGIPHSGSGKVQYNPHVGEDDRILQTMIDIREQIKLIIKDVKKAGDNIFIFGDLQDTPDNSKNFHYGKCRIPKHVGIAKTCEESGLTCSIYQHLENMELPIIPRYGSKGGRFIDGMYTYLQGLEKITGISIINDSGISTDHALIISKINLGIEQFQISKEKEERINYRKIMNIPVHIKHGDNHPTISDNV
jgi:hypothetical protein